MYTIIVTTLTTGKDSSTPPVVGITEVEGFATAELAGVAAAALSVDVEREMRSPHYNFRISTVWFRKS